MCLKAWLNQVVSNEDQKSTKVYLTRAMFCQIVIQEGRFHFWKDSQQNLQPQQLLKAGNFSWNNEEHFRNLTGERASTKRGCVHQVMDSG